MFSSDFTLTAADGTALAATHHAAERQSGDDAPRFIVIASATAVPRGFYRRFAEFAASGGIDVVACDYRGIGGSKPASLRGFETTYADWSRQDLAAAVAWCAERGPTWLVGHSLGGHAIGQLPDPNVLRAAYVCGAGAGWAGWMPRGEALKVRLMWNLVGPAATRLFGYQPMSKFGLGEDLPLGIYQDWRRWCGWPHYFFDDPEVNREMRRLFARVNIPVAALAATDDPWAPPVSRDAFMKTGYINAHPLDCIDIAPAQIGVRSIGHMGYFRPGPGAQLWPQIIAWLVRHGLEWSSRGVRTCDTMPMGDSVWTP